MARSRGDHDAKRVEIAEAACKAILRLGLAGAGLADIAREMGCTTGVLRHYFKSKDELLLFAKNFLFDRAYGRAEDVRDVHEGGERLRAMALEFLPRDAESIGRWRLLATFNGRAIGNPELMKRQHKRNTRFWGLFADEIGALQAEGVLAPSLDPKLEACGIVAFVDGLAEQVIMNPGAWPYESLAALMNRYIDGLLRLDLPSRARGQTAIRSEAKRRGK